jgi:hypothetical protein
MEGSGFIPGYRAGTGAGAINFGQRSGGMRSQADVEVGGKSFHINAGRGFGQLDSGVGSMLGEIDGQKFKSLEELEKKLGEGLSLECTNPSRNIYVLNATSDSAPSEQNIPPSGGFPGSSASSQII